MIKLSRYSMPQFIFSVQASLNEGSATERALLNIEADVQSFIQSTNVYYVPAMCQTLNRYRVGIEKGGTWSLLS